MDQALVAGTAKDGGLEILCQWVQRHGAVNLVYHCRHEAAAISDQSRHAVFSVW